MKKPLSLFVIVLLILAAYALVGAGRALRRGEVMLFIVLIAAAVIFWNRLRKRP